MELTKPEWMFTAGEQGSKGLKMRGKEAILGNIENLDFDFGEQGNTIYSPLLLTIFAKVSSVGC